MSKTLSSDRVTIYVGIGSNVDRESNLNLGIDALRRQFGQLLISPVYSCPAIGFDGDDFYNAAIAFESALSASEVNTVLRKIEDSAGRDRSTPKFSARSLDIDLLLYGDAVIDSDGMKIPRADVLKYDFVLKPLVDIAPEFNYPGTTTSLAGLWEGFDKSDSQLKLACMPTIAPLV